MPNNNNSTLRVRHGRVDSVDLYEVKENELELLENGEATSLQLNFAIALLSLAFSCVLALFTATFPNLTIHNIFLFIAIIGITGGIYLLLMWIKGRKSIKSVIQIIKNRIPPDFIEDGDDVIAQAVINPNPNPEEVIIKPEG